MTVHVLILIVLGFTGVTVTTHEFGTRDACVAAGQAAHDLHRGLKIMFTCTPRDGTP